MHDSHELLDKRGDEAVAGLAGGQAGAVATGQLHDADLGRGAVHHRVTRARLHRVHRGAYVVGVPRITPRGLLWAAALACGGPERAVISHASAASVWELLDAPREVHLITLRESRSSGGIRVHRCRTLDVDLDTVRQPDGLRITTVARTLYDISATTLAKVVRRACHEATYRGLVTVAEIDALLARHPRQPGTRKLREIVERLTRTGPQITRSEFEERFLALVESAGLPSPRVNHRVLGYTVDFFWPEARLVVETDGLHAHLRPAAFENDRERDAELHAAGYLVLRFTWRQLTERPEWVAAKLLRAYSRGVAQI